MPEVFDWRQVADPLETLAEAVSRLLAGQVLAFPTEIGPQCVASGLHPEAVSRLIGPFQVAVRGVDQASIWFPGLSKLAQRLTRRFWPGPLILACPASEGQLGLAIRNQEITRQLPVDGYFQLRCPGHEAILEILHRLPGPLLLGHAGDPDWRLVDGDIMRPTTASVIVFDETSWRILGPGSITQEMLLHHTACRVIFVCTGNTCRSPMAEALFKKLLCERIGCRMEELPQRGYQIQSAGLAAQKGAPAADLACQVVTQYGADLEYHQSRLLTPELASTADFLVTMTRNHAQTLLYYFPHLACQPRLLSGMDQDIADPIGQGVDVYEDCARQIWEGLHHLAAEVCSEPRRN